MSETIENVSIFHSREIDMMAARPLGRDRLSSGQSVTSAQAATHETRAKSRELLAREMRHGA